MLKALYPTIMWSVTTEGPHMYLTFDDGPHPIHTPRILEILSTLNARATFFVIGDRAHLHPELIRDMMMQGHTIGIHAQTHSSMLFKSKSDLNTEIDKSLETLNAITSQRPVYFRPPYGHFTPHLIKLTAQKGLKLVMWTHMTYDFSPRVSDQRIYRNISKNLHKGTIVVFHDGHTTSNRTVSILPKVIEIIYNNNMKCTNL